MIARVIVDIQTTKLDRAFSYRIPKSLQDRIKVGLSVIVPFGKGNKLIKAYVVEILDDEDED